jgi:hypothetical protein
LISLGPQIGQLPIPAALHFISASSATEIALVGIKKPLIWHAAAGTSFTPLNFEFNLQEVSMYCSSIALTAALVAGGLGLTGGLSSAKADDLAYL